MRILEEVVTDVCSKPQGQHVSSFSCWCCCWDWFCCYCLFVCSVNNILSTWRRLCLITVHNAHASVYHKTVTSVSCHLCKCRHCLCFHWENVNVKCRCMRVVCSVVLLVNIWLTIRTLVCGHIDAYMSNHLKMLDNAYLGQWAHRCVPVQPP